MSTPPDPCKCCKPRYIKFRLTEPISVLDEFASAEVELYWDGIPPDDAPAPPDPWVVDVYNLELGAGAYIFSAPDGDVGYAVWDDVEDKYRIFFMDMIATVRERALYMCGSRVKSLSNVDGMQKIYLVSASNLDPTTYECHADEHAIELKRTGVYEVVYFARLDPISTSYDSYEAATVGLRSADDLAAR